jgi:hypothetical protein
MQRAIILHKFCSHIFHLAPDKLSGIHFPAEFTSCRMWLGEFLGQHKIHTRSYFANRGRRRCSTTFFYHANEQSNPVRKNKEWRGISTLYFMQRAFSRKKRLKVYSWAQRLVGQAARGGIRSKKAIARGPK